MTHLGLQELWKSPDPKYRCGGWDNGGEARLGSMEGAGGKERLKYFSRGAPLRGRGTPAIPARLRSERARNSYRNPRISARGELNFFAAPQELVAFDRGHNADGAFIPRFGTLNASETANANGASQGNFVGQSE